MRYMSPHRQYGQHRPEDGPTHVTVLRVVKGVRVEVVEPVHPAVLRQRAAINAAAYRRGQTGCSCRVLHRGACP